MKHLADAILLGPMLKVERAYSHIDALIKLASPLSPDLHSLSVEQRPITHPHDRTVQAPGYFLTYRPTKPIPETLALIIGDAVHNARAALDHLCTGIIRTVDPGAKDHFPMHPTRKNLETAPVLKPIEQALPGATKLFLEDIRPKDGPDEALWSFNTLDNDDKHNLLIPVVTLVQLTGGHATVGSSTITNHSSNRRDATRPIELISANVPIAIQQQFTTTVDVRFPKGGLFEDQPVIPTLTQIVDLVRSTVDQFEGHMRA